MRTRHPNLIALIDAGVHSRQPFLALEYVDGISLRAWLGRGGGSPEEALGILAQVFGALDVMHRAGMAHGDIKPDNILIQDKVARVVDFGRARLHHVVGTNTGMYPGTPAYMHPALYRGGAPDARTDCFAAWVTAYEALAGRRPYVMGTLQWGEEEDLLSYPPLEQPWLNALVGAGLTGELAEARLSWLAITRALRGERTLPRPRPPPPPVDEALVRELLNRAQQDQSVALLGDPDATQPVLEALDRAWRGQGGTALWVRSQWGAGDQPLSAALALAAHAPDALEGPQLAAIDEGLGPLGPALAEVVPSARAWITGAAPPETARRPEPERLALALRGFVTHCPDPFLILASGLDQIDGSSRRFLSSMVASGQVVVVGDALPGAPHGMPAERTGFAQLPPPAPATLSEQTADLLGRARVLGLPFGALLARASGRSAAEVEAAALEAEAAGLARWTGAEVVARAPAEPDEGATLNHHLDPEFLHGGAWYAEAARRLSADADPILVARYALRGGALDRLAEVLDAAVAQATRLDPAEALELMRADPRPPTPIRVMRRFRIALLARDMRAAEDALSDLRALPDAGVADLSEAAGELAFRRGETVLAIRSYLDAAAALGRPLRRGLRGAVEDVFAFVGALLGRPPRPRPHARLANLFEHLYDLFFCHDHGVLIRVHRLWLQADPEDPRARATQLIWHTAFGQHERARALEERLLAEMHEHADPVSAAVMLLHRGIARSLRGETVLAFSDGLDAAERLLKAGDPYLAALATTLPSTCAVHLGSVGPLKLINERLTALVALTGEKRAAAWTRGHDAVICWSIGDNQGALTRARAWADESAALDDANEAFARRFLLDLHVECGDFKAAFQELARCEAVARRAHMRMDYVDALHVGALIADAQARRAGQPGLTRIGAHRRAAQRLAQTSPRWVPRVRMAEAWQLAAAGQLSEARLRFEQAERDALARQQYQDAWLVLHHEAMALNDAGAAERASTLARAHGLKSGLQALRR